MVPFSIDATIVMPVFQRDDLQRLFPQVMASILGNTHIPKQIIVVKDGPLSCAFNKLIEGFQSIDGFSVIALKKRQGLTVGLNSGIQNAKYDLIIRCDGDDFNSSDRFIHLWQLYEAGFRLIGSNIDEIDDKGSFIATRVTPKNFNDIKKFSLRRNPFNHMSVAFSKKVWEDCGGYPNIFLREDWALWVLMIAGGTKCINIQKSLVRASAGDGMYKRRSGLKNILGEYHMQRHLIRHLGKSVRASAIDFLLRSIVMSAPKWMVKRIYLLLLRNVK